MISSPSLLQEEEDYVEKGAGLAYAMFSNYESLNTDEKKSAVSHFISEMQMADDTLPLPITKPSFSERINMELQNYYAAKNNPDTNDTVEDSIDAFFGNIPLYNYLNAIFAPTERERKRNLIRGIESSLRAIENLPYTSSMMGDISIVHPYPAVVPDVQPYADTTPEPFPPAADSAGNGRAKVGDNFGKLGTMVEHPGQKVNWNNTTTHGTERMTQRGITQKMVDDWIANGKVLKQSSGNYIYITKEGVAVLNHNNELVTAYPKANFDSNMLNIIEQLFGE